MVVPRLLIALTLWVTAMPLSVLAENASQTTSVVSLRVQTPERLTEFQIPLGEDATLGELGESVFLRLTPKPIPGKKSQIHLLLTEVEEIEGFEHARPVGLLTLAPRSNASMAVLHDGKRFDIELIGIEEIAMDADLRPRRCCVVCDEVLECSSCVSTICGSCCIFNSPIGSEPN